MDLKPNSIAELSHLLACANRQSEKVSSVDLTSLHRLLEHTAEDMTATVEAGMTLAALQNELAKRSQWLPIDPPHSDKLAVGNLLSANVSGPRRFGYGTIGDYLIGMKVVLADGRIISAGGKVVKNVAGYDLAKLFIGGHGSLGVIVEATFKLRPRPETEAFVQTKCESLEKAEELIEAVLNSQITPIVLDLHRLSTLNAQFSTILGFAGTNEEVDWQLNKAREIGFNEHVSLDYEKNFWLEKSPARKISVLPSKIIEVIRNLNGAPFVARAGDGIVYHRGDFAVPKLNLPIGLMRRLKQEFDPKNILPELPL